MLVLAVAILAIAWLIKIALNRSPSGPTATGDHLAETEPGWSAIRSANSSLGATSQPGTAAQAPPNRLQRQHRLLLAIQGETDPIRRAELIRQLLSTAASDNMPALIEQIRTLPGLDDVEVEAVLTWAKTDPASAAQWALSLQAGQTRDQHLKSIATAWADQDLASAAAWLKTLPNGDSRIDSALAVAHEAARIDPIAALRILTELPASDARNDQAARAIREWTAQDPDAATRWALGIADATLRETAIAEAAAVWGSIDPEAAAIFATANLSPGSALSHVAIDILQSWTATAPQKAAAWAALFPEGDLRNSALHAIIPRWFDSDPAAVAQWLADQPSGSLKDRAIAEYAAPLSHSDPGAALDALNAVSDPPLRLRHSERIAGEWLARDPSAARAWIEESALPAESKTRLLSTPAPVSPEP